MQDGEAWGENGNRQQSSPDNVGISDDRDLSKSKRLLRVASREGAAEKGDTQWRRALKKLEKMRFRKE